MSANCRRGFVDRLSVPVYLGLGLCVASILAVVGCRPAAPGAVVPEGAAPVTAVTVGEWVGATVPREPRLHRFKWLFQDEHGSGGGRGSARIAPPDSLRFDAAGLFDIQSTAAVVIGNQPLWIDPPDALEKLVPNYPLLWAMFGIARGPDEGAELRGLADGPMTAWRYINGLDTVDYRYTREGHGGSAVLTAEVRHGREVVGRAETKMGADGTPLKAKLVVPSVPAKLDLTFTSSTQATFAPEIWKRRVP